jgi:hypothetical protein
MEEGWEKRKDGENMELGHSHHFRRMEVVPVAKFMRCWRFSESQ